MRSDRSDNFTVQEARAQDEVQNNTHRHPEEERTLDESTKRISRNISRAFQDAIKSERETSKKNDLKINDVEKTYCMIVFSLLSGVLELSWEPAKVRSLLEIASDKQPLTESQMLERQLKNSGEMSLPEDLKKYKKILTNILKSQEHWITFLNNQIEMLKTLTTNISTNKTNLNQLQGDLQECHGTFSGIAAPEGLGMGMDDPSFRKTYIFSYFPFYLRPNFHMVWINW